MNSIVKIIGDKVYYKGIFVATLNEKSIRGNLDDFKKALERIND